MKLARFETHNGERVGVVLGDGVFDLTAAGYGDCLKSLLALGPEVLVDIATAVDGKTGTVPLKEVRLLAPIPNPGKVLAIGRNYADHVKEMGHKPAGTQVWFNKQWNAVTGPYDAVELPAAAPGKVDWEGELCVVIGRRCRHVPAARAFEVVAGYMVGNDVTARNWQAAAPTLTMGKSFASHAPTGPWLTTADEVPDPQNLRLRCILSGQTVQSGSTADMIHTIAQQIEHLTKAFPLDPGDILFTGTPSGVGAGREPQWFMKAGDILRTEIDGLGAIENPLVAEIAETLIE